MNTELKAYNLAKESHEIHKDLAKAFGAKPPMSLEAKYKACLYLHLLPDTRGQRIDTHA